jgi:hypothetical protein
VVGATPPGTTTVVVPDDETTTTPPVDQPDPDDPEPDDPEPDDPEPSQPPSPSVTDEIVDGVNEAQDMVNETLCDLTPEVCGG